jgi:putative ABC transport system ATP-binding protein
LLGRSECGKTTLLNLCGAMDFPTTGEVRLAGELTSNLSDSGLTQLRRHKIGFVFQFFQLLPSLTALENVELPLLLSGANNTESTAIERLRWVGLEDKLHALPYQLSGGQMQRVAIARALVHDPAILVVEDPPGNRATASSEIILRLLRRSAGSKQAS